jgi:dTDP-4-dehydrorhamnose reductase
MRVLITGGRGQLGRALSDAFANDEVAAPGHRELDITDERSANSTIAGFRPDVVIHAAAWTDTAGCEADPERAMLVNGQAAGTVAKACVKAGARMLHVSSNEVFDGAQDLPYAEDDAPNPINVYGASKLEGERQVLGASPGHFIVRTAWVYGPGRASFPEKIIAAARERGRLDVVTDEISSPTSAGDLAEAIARLVRADPSGIYHMTNSGECSRLEWALEVLALAGLGDTPVKPVTQAQFGAIYRKPKRSALQNTRAAALGISLRPWGEALADYLSPKSPDAARDVATSNR